jgi:hypothetical protein
MAIMTVSYDDELGERAENAERFPSKGAFDYVSWHVHVDGS